MLPVHSSSARWWGLAASCIMLATLFAGSIVLGSTPVSLSDAVSAFVAFDPSSTEHIVVTTTRLPRAVLAVVVGASLAVAGALMQAMTQNPLASPSIFGINAGAIFFVVTAMTFLSVKSLSVYIWIAFVGAAVSAAIVYLLGFAGGRSPQPVRIVLAGAAITALFTSFTQAMLVLNEQGLQDALFWLAGSIAGRSIDQYWPVLPFVFTAGTAALLLSGSVNILTTGDEVSRGLGQRAGAIKLGLGIIIVVLAGSAVSVAGMIGFVGLIVPHVARLWIGQDYRWVLPYCIVLGANLMLAADIFSRYPIQPSEIPVGVTTAVIGTPIFLYLARKGLSGK